MSLTSKFKTTAKAAAISALLLGSSFNAMAESPASTSNHNASASSVSYSAPVQKVPTSREAYNASKQLGVVGFFINRAPNEDVSPAELEELAVFLLEEQGIKNHHIVSNQALSGDTTSFKIFIAKNVKQYTFASIEDGIKIAKEDLDKSIRIAKFDRNIVALNHN